MAQVGRPPFARDLGVTSVQIMPPKHGDPAAVAAAQSGDPWCLHGARDADGMHGVI